MENKKLSIVIPTIGRTLLDKTIETVLVQSVLPYEIVIWDNSGNGAAVEQSKYKDDIRIKWYVSENKKDIISSWNCAVECTSGEYVYILGDDDLLLPGFVEKVLEKLNNGAELIHTTVQIIDSADKVVDNEETHLAVDSEIGVSEFTDKIFSRGGLIYLGSLVFPRAGYEKIGRFKNIVMNALSMDILFHFEMLLLYKKITVLAAPVWQYRRFVTDWSGCLKKHDEIALLRQQYTNLRQYIYSTEIIKNESMLKKIERHILSSIARITFLYSPWQSFLLMFSKTLKMQERYYLLRDFLYLIRHERILK